jgi:2-polyprenyl-3-methyl-5-hydroxy-6-metoxy-1,4-benzoquinol methylase
MGSSRYARDIDLRDTNSPHTLAILSVPPGSRVLDIGAADGGVAAVLTQRGCRVWGVEIDKEAAFAAEAHCESVVVGDVEELDLASTFEGQTFDAILCLDVLEHLRHPAEVLRRLVTLLAPRGRVITSIPNITHAAVALQLLDGRFTYSDTGLLDETHIRFFDRAAVEQLFADAGMTVIERLRVIVPATETEIEIDPDHHAPEVIEEATSGPDADTYQFVMVAVPTTEGAPSAITSLGEELQARTIEIESYAHSLERSITDRLSDIGDLERLVRFLQQDLMVKEQYIAEMRRRYETQWDSLKRHLRERVVTEIKKRPAVHKLVTRVFR